MNCVNHFWFYRRIPLNHYIALFNFNVTRFPQEISIVRTMNSSSVILVINGSFTWFQACYCWMIIKSQLEIFIVSIFERREKALLKLSTKRKNHRIQAIGTPVKLQKLEVRIGEIGDDFTFVCD